MGWKKVLGGNAMVDQITTLISDPDKLSHLYTLIKIVVVDTILFIGFLVFAGKYLMKQFK